MMALVGAQYIAPDHPHDPPMACEAPQNRRSIRLPAFDYSAPGAYFVTIVTKERAALFGSIGEGEMRLSRAGSVADRCWREIPDHFPHVEVGSFVVMPNHVHGILILRPTAIHNDMGSDAKASEPGRGTTAWWVPFPPYIVPLRSNSARRASERSQRL
jgi:hypothetical protein